MKKQFMGVKELAMPLSLLPDTAISTYVFFFETCAIAMTTAAIPVDELVPPWTILNYSVLIYVHFC